MNSSNTSSNVSASTRTLSIKTFLRPALAWAFALVCVAASSARASGPLDGEYGLAHQDLNLSIQCGTLENGTFNVQVASVYDAQLNGSTVLPSDALAGLEAAWTAAIVEEDLSTRKEAAALKAMQGALLTLEKGINRGLSLLPETLLLTADEAVPNNWLAYEATGELRDAASDRTLQTPATVARAGGAFTLLPVALVKQGAQGKGSVSSTLDLAGSLVESEGQMRMNTQLLTTDPTTGCPLTCVATTKLGFALE